VLVRNIRIQGFNLRLFDFDYDLTWVAFFLNAEERVYGRYGGRDGTGPDSLQTLEGLKYAMQQALAVHKEEAHLKPATAISPPLRVEDYPAAKKRRGECIHCHQVNEFRREAERAAGTWSRDSMHMYPYPENVGLSFHLDRVNVVKRVQSGSAAEKAGLQAGDVVTEVNKLRTLSWSDVQFALHKAPAQGKVPITWRRGAETRTAELELAAGWKATNYTWRPSVLDLLPSLGLFGEDLTPKEKEQLGLKPTRLAFRQDRFVGGDERKAGVRQGDIIIGVDGKEIEGPVEGFLAYVRRNYIAGDEIKLNVIRDGMRIDLPMKLR